MKKLFTLATILAVMGGGCVSQAPALIVPAPADGVPATETKVSMSQFMKDDWKIMKMQKVGGESQDLSDLNLTLSFDGKTMKGKVCNSMSGPYTVTDDFVKFGNIASTLMFCEGLPGKVETTLSAGFEKGYRVTKQGEGMIMQGAAMFVLERADAVGDY